MELQHLQNNWNVLGKTDPFWAILSDPAKVDGKWDAEEFFETGKTWIAHVMAYIDSLGVDLARNRALDFGCGAGRLTQALCHYFSACAGVDIAPSMISLANQFNQHGDRCRYYLNDSDNLEIFEDNTFDFIYSFIVLQHMRPAYSKNYIKEFLRVLTPGGLASFQLPSELIPLESEDRSSQSAMSAALPGQGFRAQVAIQDPAGTQAAGTQLLLHVRVKNLSEVVWRALGAADGKYQVKLGNRWLAEDGTTVLDEDGLTMLPRDLEPMVEVELPLLVTAPAQPGLYRLEVDMVQQGVAWFKDQGSTAYRGIVEVTAGDSSDPGTDTAFVPKIQMYGVPKAEVIELVERCGGRIVDVVENKVAGEHWVSFSYCVTK